MPRSKNAKQKIDAQPALVAPVADAPFQYERSIKFEMDPKGRNSGVEIKVTEVDGALVFEIATLGRTGPRADMRGLFFDLDADLAGEGLTLMRVSALARRASRGTLLPIRFSRCRMQPVT